MVLKLEVKSNSEQKGLNLTCKDQEISAINFESFDTQSDFNKCHTIIPNKIEETLSNAKEMEVVHLKTIQITKKSNETKQDCKNL